MSINFEKPLDPETAEKVSKNLRKIFGEPVASDNTTHLFNKLDPFHQKQMGDIARLAKQPVEVEMNEIGCRKIVRDKQYILRENGWEEEFK